MAKLFTPNDPIWVDEALVEDPLYNVKEEDDTAIHSNIKIELATEVTVAGTSLTAARMNNIEDGLDAVDDAVNVEGHDAKTTPVDADEVNLWDSVASAWKSLSWANIKATLKAYFDGLYALIVATTATSDFLVGDGAGAWVKKTLAETQVILNPYALIGGVLHKQLWIGGWKPKKTAGCAAPDQLEMSTNKNVYDFCAFDKDTDENAYANIPLPQDYTGGVVYAQPYWVHPAATAFKVSFGLQGVAVANDGALDVAQGTAQVSLDEGGTTNDLYIGPLTSAITISGTPTAGKLVQWNTFRDADDATNDTLDVDAYLLGWLIWYPVR